MAKGSVGGIEFDSEESGGDMDGGLPFEEVFGGGSSGAVDDSPGDSQPRKRSIRANGDAEAIRYYFYPTWRHQLGNIIGFFILCFLTIVVSKKVVWLVVAGSLFKLGDTTYFLYLPVLSLLPGFLLGKILIRIYDAKYIIDENGVEAQIGLMSMSLRQPRLRWEDIRGVEPNQTLWERILGIGSVLVGSAMSDEVEIKMEGVANPRAIQLLIGAERERRLREFQQTNNTAAKHMVAFSD